MKVADALKLGWVPVPFVGWVHRSKCWSGGKSLVAADLSEVQDFEDSCWSDMR